MASDQGSTGGKKQLEAGGGWVLPVVIIAVAATLIYGVTKMLSTGRSHRDLVQEMHSKRFGNRWVAAFELSKLVAGGSIAPTEIPWLVDNLTTVYRETTDQRTRNFIIIALGALKHSRALPLLEQAVGDSDHHIAFNAIVAVGNLPQGMEINWDLLLAQVNSPDEAIRHAAILALASKQVERAPAVIVPRLQDQAISVRYAAALALIQYRSPAAVGTIREILRQESHPQFAADKWQQLRLNVISAIGRAGWKLFGPQLQAIVGQTSDLRVETTAREVLNLLNF